jgi:hypothetical protein
MGDENRTAMTSTEVGFHGEVKDGRELSRP